MATFWRALLLLSAMIGWFTRGKAFCNNYLWSEKWKYFSTTKRPNLLSHSKYNRSVDFRALQADGWSGFPNWYVCGYIRSKWYTGTWWADGFLDSIFTLNSWNCLVTFFFWAWPGFAQRAILELILTIGEKNVDYCPKENSLFKAECPRCMAEGEALLWNLDMHLQLGNGF